MKLEPTYITKYMFNIRHIKNIFFIHSQTEFLKSIYRISDRGEPWVPYEKEVADGELIRLTPSINQEMNH
ncbi:hypothetical protein HYP07_gp104 [Vibrio phage JSF3]|nr:hypothetical protein HYP07_gp104 [Vibrio phage JSF3]APD18116.1 hypothetical protein [Vibrio phage JSF3]